MRKKVKDPVAPGAIVLPTASDAIGSTSPEGSLSVRTPSALKSSQKLRMAWFQSFRLDEVR